MVSKIRELSETELNYVVDVMDKYLRTQISKSLGQRKIDEQQLKELTTYWIASTVEEFSLYDFDSDKLKTMTTDNILNYFLDDDSVWNRGLKEYTQMANTSLTDIIDEKIKNKGHIEILDIGCGDAAYLKELQKIYGNKITCYGISNRNQAGTETIEFRLTLAEVLPEEWTNKFDLVTSFEASMYFWNQNAAFNEALRIIKPDGKIFYGTNNLKLSMNEKIMEEKLNLKEYKYTFKENNIRAGETYFGLQGKYIENFMNFFEMLDNLTDIEEKFERHGKKFDMKQAEVRAWCSKTLQISRLEYNN